MICRVTIMYALILIFLQKKKKNEIKRKKKKKRKQTQQKTFWFSMYVTMRVVRLCSRKNRNQ